MEANTRWGTTREGVPSVEIIIRTAVQVKHGGQHQVGELQEKLGQVWRLSSKLPYR